MTSSASTTRRFGLDRPVAYGQVYATLARLLKSGLVTVDAIESGEGPDRKRYAITDAGVADVERWLARARAAADRICRASSTRRSILALRTGRSATEVLDAQRAEHLQADARAHPAQGRRRPRRTS